MTSAGILRTLVLALAALAAGAGSAGASGDAEAGERVFRKCAACHELGEGAKNKVGPQLNGIVGGPVGAQEGFTYSDALTDFAATTPVWASTRLGKSRYTSMPS